MMRRARLLALLAALACVLGGPAAHGQSEPLSFLHVGGASQDEVSRLAAVPGTAPAFVVNTGASEPAASSLSFPYHALPGTDAVSHSPRGRHPFGSGSPRLYRSFDSGGCHFVLLDSALPLTRLGHLDPAQLKWLEGDLRKVRRGAPVFVFVQHAVGATPRALDNDDELLQVLSPHRVVAVLSSGDQPGAWVANDIHCLATAPLAAGCLTRVRIDPAAVHIERLRASDPAGRGDLVASVPADQPAGFHVAFLWDDANVPVLERRRFLTELRDARGRANDARSRADYRLDGGPLQPMARDDRDKESVSFMAELLTKGLSPGAHTITLQLTSGAGRVYFQEQTFLVERVTGEPRQAWDEPFAASAPLQAGPVPASGMVVVAGRDGRVHGLDAASGRRRWSASLPAGISASPAAEGDLVVVGAEDGTLAALDAKAGRARWRVSLGGPVLASPAVLGEMAAAIAGARLVGLDRATGAQRWATEVPGVVPAAPASGAGSLYVIGEDGGAIFAVDAAGGRVRWRAALPQDGAGSPLLPAAPAFGDGRVFATTGAGEMLALDAATGRPAWRARPPAGATFSGLSPLFAGGRVYLAAAGPRGVIEALDAATGQRVWHTETGASMGAAAPAVRGNSLAAVTRDGALLCLDAASGRVQWRYTLPPGWVLSSPALASNTVYATSTNGSAYGIAVP